MMFRTAFLAWVETVEDVIAEGDKVVIRLSAGGLSLCASGHL